MVQTIQKSFVQALLAAVLLTIILGVGVDSLLINRAGLPDWLINGLPWLALAVMGICAVMLLLRANSEGKISGPNRLKNHVIGWSITSAVTLLLYFVGEPIHDFLERDIGNPILNYLVEFLHAFVGIFVNFAQAMGLFAGVMFAIFAVAIAAIGWLFSINDRPEQIERLFLGNIMSKIAAVPMVLTTLGIFVGATAWTVAHSFTNSRLLPKFDITKLNLDQYERLWGEPRWIQSIINLGIYGICSLIFTLVIGFLLAAALDRKIRFENTFRTIFLYPFALSFVVTGLVWQWILNPEFGIQKIIRDLGFESFTFDPLYDPDIVMYGLLIAGLWQGTGLVMCIMLAGLRGIDEDIWKASRVDGIPMWKTYIFIVIPMMRPVFITALVLITSGIVRLYDLVVAQTSGGPGLASEVPAKYVYDKMFTGQNLGQGFAASTMMLVTVAIILIPWAYLEFSGRKKA